MSALRVIWTLALPFVVQHCLSSDQLAPLAAFLAVGAVIMLLMLRSGPPENDLQRVAKGFGPMLASSMSLGIVFVLIGLYLRQSGQFALVLPALNNLAFLVVFAGSLLLRKPIVERFARLFHPDLSQEEERYCTRVTWMWVVFFALNIAITLSLAVWGTLTLWTIHTGAVGYLAAGALGVIEYVVRKKKFGRFTERPHDRLLRRLLGARSIT